VKDVEFEEENDDAVGDENALEEDLTDGTVDFVVNLNVFFRVGVLVVVVLVVVVAAVSVVVPSCTIADDVLKMVVPSLMWFLL
jgi:hypothetical protein